MKKIYLIIIQIIVLLSIGVKSVYANITLNYKELTIGVNTTRQLIVSGDNIDSVNWYNSNSSVATVTNGVVTGISPGTTYVNVTNGTYNATCKVTVIANYVGVTRINLPESSGTVKVNETKRINATVMPENANNKTINYRSSDTSVATVDSSGIITGKKVGTANITLTAETVSATYKITVVAANVALKGISISPQNVEINEEASSKLNVNFNPSNATNKKVTWKSSNTDVVTVDSSGNIKGVASGTATVTVISNDGGHVATVKVTVNALDKTLKGISLNKTELVLDPGKTAELTVIYEPNNAEKKEVSWRSSNTRVATVENGKITALKPGKTTITVTSNTGDYRATCEVKVTSPPIESIKFAQEEQTVHEGTTTTLETISTPEDAIIEDAIWTSSDEEVATVEDGVLTALKIGTTTITISDKEGKITASTIVTVDEAPEDEELVITIKGYESAFAFNPAKKEYTLSIGDETLLDIDVNRKKHTIAGNRDLQNGSTIEVTVYEGEEKLVYTINIKKKVSYLMHFIVAITVLLIINLIRILIKSKKKSKY